MAADLTRAKWLLGGAKKALPWLGVGLGVDAFANRNQAAGPWDNGSTPDHWLATQGANAPKTAEDWAALATQWDAVNANNPWDRYKASNQWAKWARDQASKFAAAGQATAGIQDKSNNFMDWYNAQMSGIMGQQNPYSQEAVNASLGNLRSDVDQQQAASLEQQQLSMQRRGLGTSTLGEGSAAKTRESYARAYATGEASILNSAAQGAAQIQMQREQMVNNAVLTAQNMGINRQQIEEAAQRAKEVGDEKLWKDLSQLLVGWGLGIY